MTFNSSNFRSNIEAIEFSPFGHSVALDTESRGVSRGWRVRFFLILAAFALVFGGIFPSRAMSDDVYTVIVKKQEEKKKSRWSLSEWLATKERIRLMDMWLAMNSPSPYEFFIAGDYRNANVSGGSTATGLGLAAAAYASIFGLEGQHESLAGSRQHAMFHFRIFGFQDQGTNITFQVGLRQQADASGTGSVRSAFWGGRIGACFNRFFGIEAMIRHYLDSTGGNSGVVASSNRYEGSAFIDFSMLRIYGTYFSEPGNAARNGIQLGGKIYF